VARPDRRGGVAALLAAMAWVGTATAAPKLSVESLLAGVATQDPRDPAQMQTRIEMLSRSLLGQAYRLDPLGEGPNGSIDRDPLWRFDAFDCLSLVETVVALARSGDRAEFRDELRAIRYQGGRIGFGSRNHFMEVDWIPANITRGVLTDITDRLPAEAAVAQGVIARRAWLTQLAGNPLQAGNEHLAQTPAAQAELARLAAAAAPREKVRLDYVRLRETEEPQLSRVIEAIPMGSILLIVRPNTSMFGAVGSVTQISHLGFVVAGPQGAVYRHASSRRIGGVRDAPLIDYLQQLQKTRSFSGIKVLRVNSKENSSSP
jgi:Protein of unknown function (DUF1460)